MCCSPVETWMFSVVFWIPCSWLLCLKDCPARSRILTCTVLKGTGVVCFSFFFWLRVLDKAEYSAFEFTLNSCIVSYRIVSYQLCNRSVNTAIIMRLIQDTFLLELLHLAHWSHECNVLYTYVVPDMWSSCLKSRCLRIHSWTWTKEHYFLPDDGLRKWAKLTEARHHSLLIIVKYWLKWLKSTIVLNPSLWQVCLQWRYLLTDWRPELNLNHTVPASP